MKCTKCKNKIHIKWRYCPFCSSRLDIKWIITGIVIALLVAVICLLFIYNNSMMSISEENKDPTGMLVINIMDENGFPVETDIYIYLIKLGTSSIYGGEGRHRKGIYSETLPEGRFNLKIEKEGYEVFLKNDLFISKGKTIYIDVNLRTIKTDYQNKLN